MDAIMGSGTDIDTSQAASEPPTGTNIAAVGPIQWHPIALIRGSRPPTPEADASNHDVRKPGFALIVLNQPITHYLRIIRRVWKNAFTRIAADGGANALYEAASACGDDSFDNLDVIIGDLDSVTNKTRAYFEAATPSKPRTEVIHDPSQYSTDFGKAVDYVRDQHGMPVDIVAIGGLGGRVDQGVSQLHHLYLFQQHPRYDEGRMYLFSGESLTFLLKTGYHQIRVREDGQEDVFAKWVGILPLKEPSHITTKGLEWDVTDWETEFGGMLSTSNHVLPETKVVEVHTTKDVLFTIAMRQV